MRRKGNLFRRLLFKFLPFESYLKALSSFYFLSFNSGLLKKNGLYDYPYFLDKIVGKGDVCIDIGANLGYITVVLSRLVGNEGKVYAVEPVKPILSVLKSNTKKRRNVTIYPFALGTEDKPIKLGNSTKKHKGFIASGSNYILDQKLATNETADVEFEAEMKKGSELFKDIDQLEFIKVDIEGYETVVIPELKPVISKFKPILLIEARNESRTQMLDFFGNLNYQAFILRGSTLYPASEDEFLDLIFIPEEKTGNFSEYIKT